MPPIGSHTHGRHHYFINPRALSNQPIRQSLMTYQIWLTRGTLLATFEPTSHHWVFRKIEAKEEVTCPVSP